MIAEVEAIVMRARAVLAGHPPALQGAALADLLAMWLAGHIVPGSASKTNAKREALLKMHVEMVCELIPVNDAQIHG